ncbi:outer membrane beta-barrel protein [Marinobacter caseinilyticus]|uniref:outer membrane beta-barrel protein n=1 Tax=Marinobacter caseinilyticus TaxID=2692195 RepID=UPI001408BB84|nr:outer membrane beta-barrel protein [Marinobacter caseinilyticus]
MSKVLKRLCSAALVSAIFGTSPAMAQQAPEHQPTTFREDMHYVGLVAGVLQVRSLESAIVSKNLDGEDFISAIVKDSARLSTATLVVGGHISELFHAEVRAGGGFTDAKVRNDLTLTVDYYLSWYMGIHYPLTDYANVYAQFGFSHIKGSAELTSPDEARNNKFRALQGDFPESSFSVSWLAGLDFEVLDNTYLVFEGGRLFKDTETDVAGYQFSSGLRYEF